MYDTNAIDSLQTPLLAGAARQPLFSVILSRSIYLSIYVRPQNFAAGNRWATD